MGFNYTIKTKAIRLKKNTPLDVVNFIRDCLDNNYPEPISDHSFFKTERWRSIFSHMGFDWYEKPYFNKLPNGSFELFLHADIKYGYEEIEQFADWITPYVCGHKPKEYIGSVKNDNLDRYNLYIDRVAYKEKFLVNPLTPDECFKTTT